MKTNFTKLFNYSFIPGLMILLSCQWSSVQAQNGLAFDGTDDLVITTGASSLMAGSTAISLTCWVYPSNPTPQTTSYDGLCGFRNNSDGDFYLLHYSATTLECRFRNSAGTTFDIPGGGIVLNTWQHLAFTYDGSMLRYYHDGIALDSLPATGYISTTGDDFYIGGLPFQTFIFNLIGKMDEVSLWNKALSEAEVNYVKSGCIDTSDVSLQLYYKFNQGIAGGNNTAITTLTDASGNIDGALNNFSMTGTASNFVDGVPGGGSTINAGICSGDSYTFGSQTLTASGVYVDSLISVNGCDSIVTLNLVVTSVDTSVTLFTTVLHSNTNAATYTWVNCNNNYTPIPGQTSQNYVVTTGGSYAVIVSLNGCIDTSSCHNLTFAGIEENNIADYIHVYPNPIADYLSINFDQQVKDADIQIADVEGRIIWNTKHNNSMHLKIDVSQWAAGIYVMKVTSSDKTTELRLLKK
ncbi:MAG: LamG-like jellyroll fold domain-containing protein [Bacteroidia bacterium]